jgi:hypothetical protein
MPAQRHLVDTKAECSLGADQPQGEKATFDGRVVRNRQKPGWTFSLRNSIQSPVAIFRKKAYSSSHPLAPSWSGPAGGPTTASTSSNVTFVIVIVVFTVFTPSVLPFYRSILERAPWPVSNALWPTGQDGWDHAVATMDRDIGAWAHGISHRWCSLHMGHVLSVWMF